MKDPNDRQLWITEQIDNRPRKHFGLLRAEMGINFNAFWDGIDPDADGILDEVPFRVALSNRVPRDFRGPLVLDWESPNINLLFFPRSENPTIWDRSMAECIKALDIAIEMCPRALVGFYNIPFADYYFDDTEWLNRNVPLIPILKKSKAIYPSLYDEFKNPEHTAEEFDMWYVKNNVRLYLQLMEIAGVEVPMYPHITGRFPGNCNLSDVWRSRSIPHPELYRHVKAILDAEYNGRHANGIVWWGSEESYHLESLGPPNPCNSGQYAFPFDYETYSQYSEWQDIKDQMLCDRLVTISNAVYNTNHPFLPAVY